MRPTAVRVDTPGSITAGLRNCAAPFGIPSVAINRTATFDDGWLVGITGGADHRITMESRTPLRAT